MSNEITTEQRTFREWMQANLSENMQDIANHGVEGGFYGLTYNSDLLQLFDAYGDEMMAILTDIYGNESDVLEQFQAYANKRGSDAGPREYTYWIVWASAETIAYELTGEQTESAEPSAGDFEAEEKAFDAEMAKNRENDPGEGWLNDAMPKIGGES